MARIKAGTMVRARTTFAGRDGRGVLHSKHPKSDPFPLPVDVDWAEPGVDLVEKAEAGAKRTTSKAQRSELAAKQEQIDALTAQIEAAANAASGLDAAFAAANDVTIYVLAVRVKTGRPYQKVLTVVATDVVDLGVIACLS